MSRGDRAANAKLASDRVSAEALGDGDVVSLRMWVRLFACCHLMEIGLRTELRTRFKTTLPRFDLMSQLYRNPDGVKMRELSRLLMVSCGNITGLTDRLVEEGMIQRRDDPKDRRAYYVSLTPNGRKAFQEMAVLHKRWVASMLSGLAPADLDQLDQLLGKLKRRLTPPEPVVRLASSPETVSRPRRRAMP